MTPVVIIVWEKEKSLKTLLDAWTVFALQISFSVVEHFFQAYIVYIKEISSFVYITARIKDHFLNLFQIFTSWVIHGAFIPSKINHMYLQCS